MKRINDKLKEMVEFLEQLKQIVPHTVEEYKASFEKKAACERYIEKIIEAVVDVAFLVIKTKKWRVPEDDVDAFTILIENNVIDSDLAMKLKNAKGMRNIIAHQYGKIDDEVVFLSVTEELESDVRRFIETIQKFLSQTWTQKTHAGARI